MNKYFIIDCPNNIVCTKFILQEKFETKIHFIIIVDIDYDEQYYKSLIYSFFEVSNFEIKTIYLSKKDFYVNKKIVNIFKDLLRQIGIFNLIRIFVSKNYCNWFTNPLGILLKYSPKNSFLYHSYTDIMTLNELIRKNKYFWLLTQILKKTSKDKYIYSLSILDLNKDYQLNIKKQEYHSLNLKNQFKKLDKLQKKSNQLIFFMVQDEKPINDGSINNINFWIDLNTNILNKLLENFKEGLDEIIISEHIRAYGILNMDLKKIFKEKINYRTIFLSDYLGRNDIFLPSEVIVENYKIKNLVGEPSTTMYANYSFNPNRYFIQKYTRKYRSLELISQFEEANKMMTIDEKYINILD